MASDPEEQQIKPRKRRWGVAPASAESSSSNGATPGPGASSPSIMNKTAGTAVLTTSSPPPPPAPIDDAKAKVLAMQESIRARLAAAKAKQQQQATTTGTVAAGAAGSAAYPPAAASGIKRDLGAAALTTTETSRDNQSKRARHFDVDFSVVTGPPRTTAASTSLAPKGGGAAARQPSAAASPAAAAAAAAAAAKNPYLAHVQHAKAKAAAEKKSAASSWQKKKAPKSAPSGEDDEGKVEEAPAGDDEEGGDDYDPLLAQASRADPTKRRSGRKEIRFVEPGKWQEIAQKKREIAAKAEASGYLSGRKAGHTLASATMASIYGGAGATSSSGVDVGIGAAGEDDVALPRADAVPDADGMPLVCEWWDLPLLPTRLKKEVAAMEDHLLAHQARAAMKHLEGSADAKTASEGDAALAKASNEDEERESLRSRCYQEAALAHCKTSSLVQHIVPIEPARSSAAAEKQPVLRLTKKELKRQRKLRRQARQRELQDMQAAGLIPAPEPRLTLQNFIQVMGDQAYLDPSKIEQKVQEQMEARQRAHMERNEASRLTKEQRAAKRARKYQEDTSAGVVVAVYYVFDTSHPYLRAKIDLNAQQNNITGGVLECEVPRLSCVICEGGPKAIKRYRRLMEVRMKWTGPNDGDVPPPAAAAAAIGNGDDEVPEHTFNPDNRCELVWQGMAVKRHFKGFVFQACETADQARAVLKAKGVAHYWDQVLEHHKMGRSSNALQLRLAADSSSESDQDDDDDEDIVMKESDDP